MGMTSQYENLDPYAEYDKVNTELVEELGSKLLGLEWDLECKLENYAKVIKDNNYNLAYSLNEKTQEVLSGITNVKFEIEMN